MRCVIVLAAALSLVVGCASGPPAPATLDTAHDSCRFCRMIVSDVHTAAQLVVDGDEPAFFDDLGCFRRYVGAHAALPASAAIFVADHRTGRWVPAFQAIYTRTPADVTPMSGGVIAHADAASRSLDAAARGGTSIAVQAALGIAQRGG